MIPKNKIDDVESRDFASLSEEDLLILRYWNSYRESNLWHNMMCSVPAANNCMTLAFNYAKKGKDCVLKTLALQSKLLLLWADETRKIEASNLKNDARTLHLVMKSQTATMEYVEEHQTDATPEQMHDFLQNNPISKLATSMQTRVIRDVDGVLSTKEDDLAKMKELLKARGLEAPEGAGDKTKINMNLKILDNLFWSGKISEVMYNKKSKALQLQKRKMA